MIGISRNESTFGHKEKEIWPSLKGPSIQTFPPLPLILRTLWTISNDKNSLLYLLNALANKKCHFWLLRFSFACIYFTTHLTQYWLSFTEMDSLTYTADQTEISTSMICSLFLWMYSFFRNTYIKASLVSYPNKRYCC